MKQSEIASFLDLIRNISQNQKLHAVVNELSPDKTRSRYQEEPDAYSNSKIKMIKSIMNRGTVRVHTLEHEQKTHKMWKLPTSFNQNSRSSTIKVDLNLSGGNYSPQSKPQNKVARARSNLYDNYCEIMMKKRQERSPNNIKLQKITKSSQGTSNTVDISAGLPHQNQGQVKMSKSKTLNPCADLLPCKRPSALFPKQTEINMHRIRKNPIELSVEQAQQQTKMPKIAREPRKMSYIKTKRAQEAGNYLNTNRLLMNKFEGWETSDEKRDTCYAQFLINQ